MLDPVLSTVVFHLQFLLHSLCFSICPRKCMVRCELRMWSAFPFVYLSSLEVRAYPTCFQIQDYSDCKEEFK